MIRFLDGNASLFPEAAQERYFLRALETEYRRIREWVEDEFIARGLYGKEEGAVGEDRTDVADGVIAKRLVSVRGLYESDESVIRRPLLKS